MTYQILHAVARFRLGIGSRSATVLRERNRMLRRLAHDLRNPINSILLMAQLLEETSPAPEVVRIASRIQRQCLELSGILDQAMTQVPE
jgi:signal transduction histidine kinase